MFSLNIGDDGRILSATYPEFATDDSVTVETMPDGNISDYIYRDGEYVYDPLPVSDSGNDPEQTEPFDYAAEIQALKDELAATKILLGVE